MSVSAASAVPARHKTSGSARPRRSPVPAAPVAPAPETAATLPPQAVCAPAHEEVAALAYSYWEARGRQGGCPAEDWTRAESELLARAAASAV